MNLRNRAGGLGSDGGGEGATGFGGARPGYHNIRARCPTCLHRFPMPPVEYQAPCLIACPRCHLMIPPEAEPVDQTWWHHTSARVV